MADKVKPRLVIELRLNCSECGHGFDLISDTNLNDEGGLLDQLFSNRDWINAHEQFECTAICPQCSVGLDVSGVEW